MLSAIYRILIWGRDAYWSWTKPTLVGVRAVVVRGGPGGEVLLVRHRGGEFPWSLPGGGVERHERMEEAARREVWEETGVRVKAGPVLGLYDSFRLGITNYIAVVICAPSGEPAVPRSIEIAEARFFPLGALPAGLDPGSQRRLAEYSGGERGVLRMW